MKLNVNKSMQSNWKVFDMDKYNVTSNHNKHKNRFHRVRKMFKAKWNRELNKQFKEEIDLIYK